jgi:parallel beta-helix repeat protein
MLRINGVKTLLAALFSLLPLSAIAQQTAQINVNAQNFPAKVRPGNAAAIDLIATNFGPADAENAVVTITPPDGATVHVSGMTCDESKVPIVCSIGTIVAQRGRSIHLTETFPPALGAYATKLSIRSSTPDSQPFHESQFAIEVSNDPDLTVSTDHFPPSRFDPNARFGTIFTVKNDSEFDAHDLVLIFSPIIGFVMKDGTYGAFNCAASTGDGRCTTPLLRAGESLSFEPDIRVGPSTDGGRLALQTALISREADFNFNNNRTFYFGVAYRTFTVSNTAEFGFGTLREALIQSSTGCSYSEHPCKITFAIAEPIPSSGWFTIAPEAPLPAVTTDGLIIDARTQTAFSGDTNPAGPEVELSGQRSNFGNGIELKSGQLVELRGLAINGFVGYGIAIGAGGVAYQAVVVDGNYVGTDPTGSRAVPNGRGIGISGGGSVQISNNVISGNQRSGIFIGSAYRTGIANNKINSNGASGVYISNAANDTQLDQNDLSFNGEFGVAIAPDAKDAFVRRSTMRGNGIFALDVGLDLRTPNSSADLGRLPNAPLLTGATYDPVTDKTTITGTELSECASCNLFIDIFASSTRAANGTPQAERYLGTAQLGGYSSTTKNFTLSANGDLRGQLITATTSRSLIPQGLLRAEETEVFGTSELSEPLMVK